MNGLSLVKNKSPEASIEHFDLAKKFNPLNVNIYIAKGCALANMVIIEILNIEQTDRGIEVN